MKGSKFLLSAVALVATVSTTVAFKAHNKFGSGNLFSKTSANGCRAMLTCHTGVGTQACAANAGSLYTKVNCPTGSKWNSSTHHVTS